MKVKTPVKVFLIALVAIGAFFLIRNYQSKHPSKTVTVAPSTNETDTVSNTTTVVIETPTETETTKKDGVSKKIPVVKNVVVKQPKNVKKEKVVKPEVKKESTKPGERKNLEISNL